MKATHNSVSQASSRLIGADSESVSPFSREFVSITKEEYIGLIQRRNYWEAQHALLKKKLAKSEQDSRFKDAKIKDLQKRLFGKSSEKTKRAGKTEKGNKSRSNNKRGQQPGSKGHGRTKRPDLLVVKETHDLQDDQKLCSCCGLPFQRKPALDEQSDFIEVSVQAHIRRILRPGYARNDGCHCSGTPAIISAPALPRLITNSPYQVSFWVEVILGKYRYAQPTHRYLQDLSDQGLPVSPGTVAGGLQAIAPLFEPLMEILHQKQMTESLFHNDETRWEVFVEVENKVGSRWYLWVTRSQSVIYFILDPSRSTDVPKAHFANLQNERVIIVCDRYSAYKKLARLSDIILLAFCWVHVRRDFLGAGNGYKELEFWALIWKERIAKLYHENNLRVEQWDEKLSIDQQNECFKQHHHSVQEILKEMYDEATLKSTKDDTSFDKARQSLPVCASTQQRKICQSLLNHWQGLTLFVENPHVPLDNNIAENTIRGPVIGRKNYYGSGSLWSANLTATLFSILNTLKLWDINPRHWLTAFLTTCANNGGKPPEDLAAFIPWQMSKSRLDALSRPQASPPAQQAQSPPDQHSNSVAENANAMHLLH